MPILSKTEYNRKYYHRNKERILQGHKGRMLRRNYGVTLDEYNELFRAQEGCCAICGVHQGELKKALHLDHDHDTKQIRGLLCKQCNTGLGMFKDSAENLMKAVKYLGQNSRGEDSEEACTENEFVS